MGRPREAPAIEQVESALQGSIAQVRPPESFRRQLGESLGMAAHSRAAGLSVQAKPRPSRWAVFITSVTIALSVTITVFLVRRLGR
ncbi:MAG: hypothetical protein ABFD20_01925 [Anaerolineales bacterium]